MRTVFDLTKLSLVVLVALMLSACETIAPSIQTGPDAEVSYDGLNRISGARAEEAWALADLDLSSYSKIKFDGLGIEYRPGGKRGTMAAHGATEFNVTEAQKNRLSDLVNEVFTSELSKSSRFALVEEAGDDVLLLQGRLLDVVSHVPPASAVRTDIYLRSVGEATLVLELRDSSSNAILGRVVDRRAAESVGKDLVWSNPVSNAAEVRRVVQRWATSFRTGLETLAAE